MPEEKKEEKLGTQYTLAKKSGIIDKYGITVDEWKYYRQDKDDGFINLVAKIFQSKGYITQKPLQKVYDRDIDIIAEKEKERVLIDCKNRKREIDQTELDAYIAWLDRSIEGGEKITRFMIMVERIPGFCSKIIDSLKGKKQYVIEIWNKWQFDSEYTPIKSKGVRLGQAWRESSKIIRGIKEDRTPERLHSIPISGVEEVQDITKLQEEHEQALKEPETLEQQKAKEKRDITELYNESKPELPENIKLEIDKAIERFYADDYVSTIVNAYRVSEIITRELFKYLYGEKEAEKVGKHEDRLKRIWNDDQLEKHEYPGISLIASLFSTILWYRNKMGAHTEMHPTREAARISLISLLQSIEELKRLEIINKITTQIS